MTLNVPDKIYKLSILVGLVMAASTFFMLEKHDRWLKTVEDEHQAIKDSLDLSKHTLNYYEKNILTNPHPTKSNYSVPLAGTNSDIFIDYNNLKLKIFILDKKLSLSLERLEKEIGLMKSFNGKMIPALLLSIGLIGFGIAMWVKDEDEVKPTRLEGKIYMYCQSCGSEFNSMLGYGKESNGSTNNAFCIECYDMGKFTGKYSDERDFIKAHNSRDLKDDEIVNYRTVFDRRLERWEVDKKKV